MDVSSTISVVDQLLEPASSSGYSTERFEEPYLLVIDQLLPFYRNSAGSLFANELWQKDLRMHLAYLGNLMIACPCLLREPPTDAVSLDHLRFEVIEMPVQRSAKDGLKKLPVILRQLWLAVGRATVVHSTIAGWPFPMGWLVLPIAIVRGKLRVIVVESAPWRLQSGLAAGWRKRLRAGVQEVLGRWFVRNASLTIFTQDEYRRSMMGGNSPRGHVIPASWIDEENVLDDLAALALWKNKRLLPHLRILFAGRLVAEKGLQVLLDAMAQLNAEGFQIALDILGDGPQRKDCDELKALTGRSIRINTLGVVPYGEPFLLQVRGYDAVVIPSISDEQPRLVFDAYSQAVPVLASSTPGLRSCVREGETGRFFAPNDAHSLAELLKSVTRDELAKMGLRCLSEARSMTHEEMHRKRAALLAKLLHPDQEKPLASSSESFPKGL
jgi:glycosyltransferase involved in cell wall biosynthesis